MPELCPGLRRIRTEAKRSFSPFHSASARSKRRCGDLRPLTRREAPRATPIPQSQHSPLHVVENRLASQGNRVEEVDEAARSGVAPLPQFSGPSRTADFTKMSIQ